MPDALKILFCSEFSKQIIKVLTPMPDTTVYRKVRISSVLSNMTNIYHTLLTFFHSLPNGKNEYSGVFVFFCLFK